MPTYAEWWKKGSRPYLNKVETRLSSAGVSSQDERIHVIKVLRTIFPNEFGSPSKFRSTGVSDPDYFDRYFLFGIPEGDVSDTQVITDIRAAIQMEVGMHSEISFPETFTASTYRERTAAILKGYRQFVSKEADVVPLARFLVWLLKLKNSQRRTQVPSTSI